MDLLEDALTHPGASLKRSAVRRAAYERLEFLGDRVLGLVVAELLFQSFPKENEGHLARRHAGLVRREALARIARDLSIDTALVVGSGDVGSITPTMLADACEAVLGAVYADGGLAPAATIIRRHWTPLMAEATLPPKDAKTGLQEWAQGRGLPLPQYTLLGTEGPAHNPEFLVSVSVEGHDPMTARGASKRVAEQAAAQALWDHLNA